MNKKYILEPDLVTQGRYFIQEHTDTGIRTALIVYQDFELATRILKYLQGEQMQEQGKREGWGAV